MAGAGTAGQGVAEVGVLDDGPLGHGVLVGRGCAPLDRSGVGKGGSDGAIMGCSGVRLDSGT